METQWQAQERQRIAAVRDTDRSRQEAQLLEDDRREVERRRREVEQDAERNRREAERLNNLRRDTEREHNQRRQDEWRRIEVEEEEDQRRLQANRQQNQEAPGHPAVNMFGQPVHRRTGNGMEQMSYDDNSYAGIVENQAHFDNQFAYLFEPQQNQRRSEQPLRREEPARREDFQRREEEAFRTIANQRDLIPFEPPRASSRRDSTPPVKRAGIDYRREEKLDARKFLSSFSGKTYENVDTWFYKLELYFKQFSVQENEKLMTCISLVKDAALLFFRSLESRVGAEMSYKLFRQKFYERYQPVNLQTVLRTKLRELKQTRTVANYIDEFDKLCCQIRGMSEEDQVQFFIAGLKIELSERVAFEEPTLIDTAKELAIKNETYYKSCQSQRQDIQRSSFKEKSERYNKDNSKGYRQPERKPGAYEKPKNASNEAQQKDERVVKCYICGDKGHYANECKKGSKPKYAGMAQETRNIAMRTGDKQCQRGRLPGSANINMVDSNVKGGQNLMIVKGKIDGRLYNCVIDTGATVSIMSKRVADRTNVQLIRKTPEIRLADGQIIKGAMTKPLKTLIKGISVMLQFVVMENDELDILIGLDWIHFTKASINPSEGKIILPERGMQQEEEREEQVLLTEIKDSDEDFNDDTWDIPEHCADIPESDKIGVEKSQVIKNFIANNRSSFATSYQEIGTCNVSEFSIKLMSDEPIYIPPYSKSQSERKAIKKGTYAITVR